MNNRSLFALVLIAALMMAAATACAERPTRGAYANPRASAGLTLKLEINGIGELQPLEVIGLEEASDIIEYQDGEDVILRKRAGRNHIQDIIVRFSLDQNRLLRGLLEWRRDVVDGQLERKAMSIILMKPDGQEAKRWNLLQCWPSAYRVVDLRSGGAADPIVEEFSFTYESLEIVDQ